MTSRRRKILFLTHRVPFPPDKGDKIRTFHQLDHLAVDHDVYCACFIDHPDDRVHAIALQRWCKGVFTVEWRPQIGMIRALRALGGDRALSEAAYDDPRMHRQIDAWSSSIEFDAVVAFSACMAPYARRAAARRRVLDLCDSDSAKWQEYAALSRFPMSAIHALEARRLRALELACIEEFDATAVISERERRTLDPTGTSPRLHVIANGVDLPYAVPPQASRQGPIVSFIGEMSYRPNRDGMSWFMRTAWPHVRARVRDAQLMIVGRNPPADIVRLAKLPGVTVTGEVPEVRRYLASSRVVIAPLRIARGMPNKVLEAMAMQRPVVATSTVADCLDIEPGRHVLIADEPLAFASQVVRLLESDGLCDRVAESGYRHAAGRHSWTDTMRQYEQLLFPSQRSAHDKSIKSEREAQFVRDRSKSTGDSPAAPFRTDFGRPIQTLTGKPYSAAAAGFAPSDWPSSRAQKLL
jgi:sugar transferase (PEP-CTERM/EpsH1 system associated)